MTPNQEERLRTKIANIRKELAADKKRWGGFYHDGRGLRIPATATVCAAQKLQRRAAVPDSQAR